VILPKYESSYALFCINHNGIAIILRYFVQFNAHFLMRRDWVAPAAPVSPMRPLNGMSQDLTAKGK